MPPGQVVKDARSWKRDGKMQMVINASPSTEWVRGGLLPTFIPKRLGGAEDLRPWHWCGNDIPEDQDAFDSCCEFLLRGRCYPRATLSHIAKKFRHDFAPLAANCCSNLCAFRAAIRIKADEPDPPSPAISSSQRSLLPVLDSCSAPLVRVLKSSAKQVEAPCVEEELKPIHLDLGFARCRMGPHPDWGYEFHAEILDYSTTDEGMQALFEFLGIVLVMREIAAGFVLTCDFRGWSKPPIDFLTELLRWGQEPARQAVWSERCRHWQLVASDGPYFTVSRYSLSLFFYLDPPICLTYLVTSTDRAGLEDAVYYEPENPEAESKGVFSWQIVEDPVSALASLGSIAYGGSSSSSPQTPRRRKSLTVAENKSAKIVIPEFSKDGVANLDVGFAQIHSKFDEKLQLGCFTVMMSDGVATDEGVQGLLDFMEVFTYLPVCEAGFGTIYDLRCMNMPSMHLVMAIGDWANEPARKKRWEDYQKICIFAMRPGIAFAICKGVLTSLFLACPPVCRTYLVNDPDDLNEDNATIFEAAIKKDGPQSNGAGKEAAKKDPATRKEGPVKKSAAVEREPTKESLLGRDASPEASSKGDLERESTASSRLSPKNEEVAPRKRWTTPPRSHEACHGLTHCGSLF